MSSSISCPICNKSFPPNEISKHANLCLDNISNEISNKDSESSIEKGVILKDIDNKSESKFHIRSKIKNKIKKLTLQEEMNEFVDISESKNESEPSLNDWIILKETDHLIESKFRVRSKIKNKIRKLSVSEEIDEFVHVDNAKQLITSWNGCDNVDMHKFTNDLSESEESFNKRIELWKNIKIPDTRTEVVSKLKYVIRKGISYQRRKEAWKAIGSYNSIKEKNSSLYKDTYSMVFGDTTPESIVTFPQFSGELHLDQHYISKNKSICIYRILCAIATNHIELDFCKTLCDLVPILLMFLSEEETFYLTEKMIRLSLMDNYYFSCSSKQSIKQAVTFSALVKKKHYNIYSQFQKYKISIEDVANNWFDRLFVGYLPYDTVLRVFDCYLSEGKKILFRVGLGILDSASSVLMQCTSKKNFIITLNSIGSHFTNHNSLMFRSFRYFLTSRKLNSLDEDSELYVTEYLDISEPEFQVFYRPKFPKSAIITTEQFEILYTWLPKTVKIKDPLRLFFSDDDGCNLKTMIQQSFAHNPTILLIKATTLEIFGAFITGEWNQSTQIFGSNEMFLFTIHPTISMFASQPEYNTQYIRVTEDHLEIGNGNKGIGLYLDEELWKGSSHESATYLNDPLVPNSEFKASKVELWGFISE